MIDSSIIKRKAKATLLLKKFLKQEGIVEKFNNNFISPKAILWRTYYMKISYKTPRCYFNHLVLEANIFKKKYEHYNLSQLKEFFKNAFNWSDSLEGYGFWKKIHDKWYTLVILFYNNGS